MFQSVRYYRMRLVVLGDEGAGKSTLVQNLVQPTGPKKLKKDDEDGGVSVVDWR